MATTDVLTIDEARAAIGAASDATDTYLETLIEAVSERLDDICGPIVTRSVTEYHNGGCTTVAPYEAPVSSFTSITEADGTTTTALTAESFGTAGTYLFDPVTQTVRRRSAFYDATFPSGLQNVRLVYSAGRYASTAAVASRFKEAAKIIVAHIWRNERGSGNQTYGADGELSFRSSYSIPNRALELIAGDIRYRGIA